MIRAVFFDAGDTLLHKWVHKTKRFRWLCEQATIPVVNSKCLEASQAQEVFFQNRHMHHNSGSDEWWEELAKIGLSTAKVTGDLDEMSKVLAALDYNLPEYYVVDELAIPVLQCLRMMGYRLVIVSNWDGTLLDHAQRSNLAGYFDAVIDSSVVGVKKPDPQIFHLACSVSGVKPNEAIHIGDSPYADAQGALAAGIRPIIYDPLDALREQASAVGVERIRKLSEVLEVLGISEIADA